MGADDKTADKADEVRSGVEGALGSATDSDQTHSESDKTGGSPDVTDDKSEATTYGGE